MKKAIVIGATSGIGRELAKLLSECNYVIGIMGRRTKLLDETDLQQTEEKLRELTEAIGGLDLLILSSGIGDLNSNLDFEVAKKTIETNALGFSCITNGAFNLFEKQNFGHLVAITSVGGLRGSRHAPAYNATFAKSYLREDVTKMKWKLKLK